MALFRTRKTKPALQRDSVPLRFSDGSLREVVRVRDPRARRIRLIVSEGRVRLTLPRWASAREGDAFLHTHRDWLQRQLEAQEADASRLAPLRHGDPGPVTLRGVPVALRWHEGLFARADLHTGPAWPDLQRIIAGAGAPQASRHAHASAPLAPEATVACGTHILVTAPRQAAPATIGAAMGALLEAEARRDIGALLPRYLPSLPRAPLSVRIRPLSSLWGSLSVRDGLSLDLALVLAPPAALEYVLVHELCHLLHGDHSARFWASVEQRFPDWRPQRDYLRRDGPALKSELKRLLGRT